MYVVQMPPLALSCAAFLANLSADEYKSDFGGMSSSARFSLHVLSASRPFVNKRQSERNQYKLNENGVKLLELVDSGKLCDPNEWVKNPKALEWFQYFNGNNSQALNALIAINASPDVIGRIPHPVAQAILDASRLDSNPTHTEKPIDGYQMRGGQISAYTRQALNEIGEGLVGDLQKSEKSRKGGVSNALEYCIMLTYYLWKNGKIGGNDDY